MLFWHATAASFKSTRSGMRHGESPGEQEPQNPLTKTQLLLARHFLTSRFHDPRKTPSPLALDLFEAELLKPDAAPACGSSPIGNQTPTLAIFFRAAATWLSIIRSGIPGRVNRPD